MNEPVKRLFSVEFAVSFILICGAVTSSVIAIVVIAIPLVAPLSDKPYTIPQQVGEWGGVIIGFYFGAFVSFAANVWKSKREGDNDRT